jgi:hypothetical protein
MRYRLGAAFAVAFAASITPAMADQVQVGQLVCRGASQQFVVGSITNLDCMFRPSTGARPQAYAAQIRRVGLDIGINQSTALLWSVFAPTRSIPRGGLSGTYVGGSANVTIGVGIGANALFGGSNSTIALQPLSGQGQIGLGVVGGISSMEMRPAEPPRKRRYRSRR